MLRRGASPCLTRSRRRWCRPAPPPALRRRGDGQPRFAIALPHARYATVGPVPGGRWLAATCDARPPHRSAGPVPVDETIGRYPRAARLTSLRRPRAGGRNDWPLPNGAPHVAPASGSARTPPGTWIWRTYAGVVSANTNNELALSGSWITLDNLDIENGLDGIHLDGGSHYVIENCTVTHCAEQGILAGRTYPQIFGNYVDCIGGEVVGGSDGVGAAGCSTTSTPAAARPSTTTSSAGR